VNKLIVIGAFILTAVLITAIKVAIIVGLAMLSFHLLKPLFM
jgi:hypothetical protein